ncbi:hypothetical protein PTKIN_Ptkin01aG0074100 [Pterospermum kingtungense]
MVFSADLPKGVHMTSQRKKGVPSLLTKAQLKSIIFKSFDITTEHLPRFLSTKVQAGRGLSHADGNGDGYVSDDELDDLVKYALQLGYSIK